MTPIYVSFEEQSGKNVVVNARRVAYVLEIDDQKSMIVFEQGLAVIVKGTVSRVTDILYNQASEDDIRTEIGKR